MQVWRVIWAQGAPAMKNLIHWDFRLWMLQVILKKYSFPDRWLLNVFSVTCTERKTHYIVFSVFVKQPTSLSRLAFTCSGLSDMTKSLVVSTEGATPSVSGANWTFLSISFTVLLLEQRKQRKNVEIINAYKVLRLIFSHWLRWAETHRLRTLPSWLSALNALISNSTAHCYRRREKRCHHPVMCSPHQYRFGSSVRILPCRHRGALAGEPLSKAGCQETEKTKTRQSVSNQYISPSAFTYMMLFVQTRDYMHFTLKMR